MNIGFDLDKIFVDYPPFVPDTVIDKLYKKKAQGTLEYRIPTRPEQLLRRLTHLPVFRPPIQHNLAFLSSLPKSQHKLYLISSRYHFLESVTHDLIKKHHFDKIFDGMYFNFENKQAHEFKNDVIKKLNLDRYVDDDLPLLSFVAKHNKKTNFYWLNRIDKKGTIEKNITAIMRLPEMLS